MRVFLSDEKLFFQRNTVLLIRHHAAPVVTLFFSLAYVNRMTLRHTLVIRYSTSVTYRTVFHASGHLVVYGVCCRFEKAFFTLRCFLPCFSSCFLGLPWGRQFNLKASTASCWSLKHSHGFVWIPTIHISFVCCLFYLKVRASHRTLSFTEN